MEKFDQKFEIENFVDKIENFTLMAVLACIDRSNYSVSIIKKVNKEWEIFDYQKRYKYNNNIDLIPLKLFYSDDMYTERQSEVILRDDESNSSKISEEYLTIKFIELITYLKHSI